MQSSRLIEEAVDQVASLPGIGRKTALRLVLDLLKRKPEEVNRFAQALTNLRNEISYCSVCHHISDAEKCSICSDSRRDEETICVVRDIRDVMALESTGQYRGKYHILGGIISPMDGVGPSDLNVESLLNRLTGSTVQEVILALNATMEGETTAFYLYRKIEPMGIRVTSIARGVAVGGELEYTDEVTLGRSILLRTPYEAVLKR